MIKTESKICKSNEIDRVFTEIRKTIDNYYANWKYIDTKIVVISEDKILITVIYLA